MTDTHAIKRKPVPRGIAHTGPVILAYGFRPFFLGAGIWAVLAMGNSFASANRAIPATLLASLAVRPHGLCHSRHAGRARSRQRRCRVGIVSS